MAHLMSILQIARLGNPVLRRRAREISREELESAEVQRLIDNLLESVAAADGAGLAAPQVHESLRIVVLQLDASRGMEVWVNPVLVPLGEETKSTWEGCLSVPGLRGKVRRPARVQVDAWDRNGEAFTLHLAGFPAVVAQHECDHLDGVIYVDKVEPGTLGFVEELRRFPPTRNPNGGDESEDREDAEDEYEEDELDLEGEE
jgi:peptide deformylase